MRDQKCIIKYSNKKLEESIEAKCNNARTILGQ